jgi:hypothetical protein
MIRTNGRGVAIVPGSLLQMNWVFGLAGSLAWVQQK